MAERTGKQKAGRLTSIALGLDGDPATVAIVRRIFSEFCGLYAHATLSEIARGLTLDEVPTARGGAWYPATVRYVLTNRDYVAHEVISEDTYNRAQGRLQALKPGPPK